MNPRGPAAVFLISIFLLSQIPFGLGEWIAIGQAPEESGIYDVIIRATYDGITDTFPLVLNVGGQASSLATTGAEGLFVEPVYPFSRQPPIQLRYKITIENSTDINMMSNNLSVYYLSGNTLLKSEQDPLSWYANGSYWYTNVNVPFKGDYEAVINLLAEKEGQFYNGSFVSVFSSDNPSSDLVLD